jgi:PTH1 family peptidyl-tRNA hydrolase
MKIIIGLGNPESKYDGTRHNVGFRMLDSLAHELGVTFGGKPKFKADIAEGTIHDERVILVKPNTFYNETGEAMRLIADFYKIDASDILIVHDELALPFGTIRTRQGGSDAGSNGIKSVNAHGGEASYRLRIGIWNELRDRMDDVTFVLGKFSADEQAALTKLEPTVHSLIEKFCQGSLEPSTHR